MMQVEAKSNRRSNVGRGTLEAAGILAASALLAIGCTAAEEDAELEPAGQVASDGEIRATISELEDTHALQAAISELGCTVDARSAVMEVTRDVWDTSATGAVFAAPCGEGAAALIGVLLDADSEVIVAFSAAGFRLGEEWQAFLLEDGRAASVDLFAVEQTVAEARASMTEASYLRLEEGPSPTPDAVRTVPVDPYSEECTIDATQAGCECCMARALTERTEECSSGLFGVWGRVKCGAKYAFSFVVEGLVPGNVSGWALSLAYRECREDDDACGPALCSGSGLGDFGGASECASSGGSCESVAFGTDDQYSLQVCCADGACDGAGWPN